MNDFTVHQDDLRWQYIVFVVSLQVSYNALHLLSYHQTVDGLMFYISHVYVHILCHLATFFLCL